MITDNELYQLAIFMGSASMALIVLYHYLEVNSEGSTTPSAVAAMGKKQNKPTA